MPLTGFICCQDHEVRSFDECICRAQAGGCLYPLHLLVRIRRKQGERSSIPHDFSATALPMCPRKFALEDRIDYAEHPQDFIARDRGDSHHHWVETSGPFPGVVQEDRMFKRYGSPEDPYSFLLSGKADWRDPPHRELIDHKTCGWMPKEPYDSHEAQLNIYADLDDTVEYTSLKVEYFDGRRYQTFPVRVWSPEERREYILRRGSTLMRARLEPDYIPPRVEDYPDNIQCRNCPVRAHCEELGP